MRFLSSSSLWTMFVNGDDVGKVWKSDDELNAKYRWSAKRQCWALKSNKNITLKAFNPGGR